MQQQLHEPICTLKVLGGNYKDKQQEAMYLRQIKSTLTPQASSFQFSEIVNAPKIEVFMLKYSS